eukprot:334322_1
MDNNNKFVFFPNILIMGNESGKEPNDKISDELIAAGKLKAKNYPSDIDLKVDQWIPIEFLSNTQQNQEVILSVTGDQRVRATPSDYHYDCNETNETMANKNTNELKNAIYNIGRLKMEFSATLHAFGSGFIIHNSLNKSYVLTAAHNLIIVDQDDKDQFDYPLSVWFEINQNLLNHGYTTLKRYKCNKYYIHPKYIEYCKSNISQSATGFDIAIIEVLDPQNELKKIKPFKLRQYQSEISIDSKIKVIGYPGELTLRGELYGMIGDGNMGFISKRIQINPLIAYKDIDTSDGQSGCPIFKCLDIETKTEENDINIYESFGEIVGIHVVGKKTKKLNYGTFLNDDLLKWIYTHINIKLNDTNLFNTIYLDTISMFEEISNAYAFQEHVQVMQQKFKSKAKANHKILMLSLHGAGTTTLLYKLKLYQEHYKINEIIQTVGINVEHIEYRNVVFTIWDFSGVDKVNSLWKLYYSEDVSGIIFVIDSHDEERIDELKDNNAKQALHEVLSSDKLNNIPLLVYANKQDLLKVMSLEEITERLDLNSITNRSWYVQDCSAVNGSGIYEGLDWLSQSINYR